MTIRSRIRIIGSPNYYYGNSVTKLFAHNFIEALGLFKRRGPSRILIQPLKAMKNSKKGKKALVLGSGPSLDKLNLESTELSKYEVFAVNSFFQSPASKFISPAFYCLSDPNYFVEDRTNTTFQDEPLLEYLNRLRPVLLISHFYRKSDKYRSLESLYFNDRELRWMRRSINPTRPRSYVSLTLYKALATAIYFGYDEILILGMDNNEFAFYESNSSNEIYVNFSRYFSRGISSDVVGKKQIPEGFTSGMSGRLQFFGQIYGDLFKFARFNVWNLDENSLVDAFPKKIAHPLIKKT